MSTDVRSPDLPNWDVIDRYLSGEATPDETALVGSYLAREPEVGIALKRLSATYAGKGSNTPDVVSAWTTLVERIAAAGPSVSTRPFRIWPRASLPLSRRGWPMAVSVLATVLIAVIGGRAIASYHTGASPRMTTYTTRNGQRADVTLADGSTVSLNVGSRLDVPADYVSGNRVLRLSGEALFTVLHHSRAPFTVIAGHTVTRVLGTSFVVRHYATDTTSTIAVRDGKVDVQSIPLVALQQANVTSDGRVHVQQADRAIFAFATGTLILDWMPLREAIPSLQRWYDTQILVADSAMLARPIKGAFAAGSAADLSQILAVTLHARVVRDGRALAISPQ